MEDLAELADACHEKGMVLCLDFVLNHTSEEHPWAKAARAGDRVARSRYFFYDNWDIPKEFEKTVPQVFPTTAPGNFTQLPDGQIVMTSFYPFQWDLNYANPMVFNDMVENLLFLANQGMDVIRLDAVPYIWKELGTDCRNLPKVAYAGSHDAFGCPNRLSQCSSAGVRWSWSRKRSLPISALWTSLSAICFIRYYHVHHLAHPLPHGTQGC